MASAAVVLLGQACDGTWTDVTSSDGGSGQILYLAYCQGCHGLEGHGDGPAAASLRIPPADLSQLWRSYGSPLDRGRLVEYIDGRQLVAVHGSRKMPIWGDEFFEGAPEDTPRLEETRRNLFEALATYLELLQDEPDD
jgi:mono/diheme cytochrome c family protein